MHEELQSAVYLFPERIEHQPLCRHRMKRAGSAAHERIHKTGQRQQDDLAPATGNDGSRDANIGIVILAVADDRLDAGAGEQQSVAAGDLIGPVQHTIRRQPVEQPVLAPEEPEPHPRRP